MGLLASVIVRWIWKWILARILSVAAPPHCYWHDCGRGMYIFSDLHLKKIVNRLNENIITLTCCWLCIKTLATVRWIRKWILARILSIAARPPTPPPLLRWLWAWLVQLFQIYISRILLKGKKIYHYPDLLLVVNQDFGYCMANLEVNLGLNTEHSRPPRPHRYCDDCGRGCRHNCPPQTEDHWASYHSPLLKDCSQNWVIPWLICGCCSSQLDVNLKNNVEKIIFKLFLYVSKFQ